MAKPYSTIEVSASVFCAAYLDHGRTYWCALKRYNPQTKGYDVIDDARANNYKAVPAIMQGLVNSYEKNNKATS